MRLPLVALACAALSCATSVKRPPVEPFRYQGHFATYPTGLRLVAFRTSHAKRATVIASYDVGDADDPRGKEGLARLAARLTAVAAPASGGLRLRERLFAAGVIDSAKVGADSTDFQSIVRLARLDEALAIEADRLREPLAGITKEEVAREGEALARELAADQGATEGASVFALAWRGTRYDRAPPTPESVRALTLEDVRSWASQHLVPDRLVLVVSVPEAPSEAVRRVLAAFGALATTGAPDEPRVSPAERPSVAGREPVLWTDMQTRSIPGTKPHLWLAWPLPGMKDGTSASAFAATVVLQQRLWRAREGDLAARVTGVTLTLERGHQGSALLARIELRSAEDAAPVRNALLHSAYDARALDDYAQHVAVRALARRIDVGLWDMEEGPGPEAAWRLRATGEPDPLAAFAREARTQLGRSFEEYYRKWITVERAVSVAVLPGAGGPPTEAPLDEPGAWIPIVRTLGAAAPGATEVRELLDPPRLGEAFQTRLSNGLRVVVLPHGERPIVEARLLVDSDPVGGAGGSLVPSIALAASEKAWTLAGGHTCRASPFLPRREKISFRERGSANALPEMLGRLACWTRRSLDGDRVDAVREGMTSSLARGEATSASMRAGLAISSALYSPEDDPLASAPLAGLKAEPARRWLLEQLRPERSLLVIAGKIMPTKELLADVEARFGGWKRRTSAPGEHASPPLPARRHVLLVDVPGAELATVAVAYRLPLRKGSDEAGLLAVQHDVGTRLVALAGPAGRILIHHGGLPHAPTLSTWATLDARQVPGAIQAALDAVRNLAARPLASVDANLARWLVARWQAFRFDTTSQRIGAVEELFFSDLPLDAWEGLPASIASLTPERIQAAAQAVNVGREQIVVQGDAATLAPALRDAGLSPEVLPAPQPAR
ncbi:MULTISPECIES: pitrilysin family protein [unclassified Anaeromyxobacter]|uniref:M16 family metallopeptidase n=1 Tax=unclassified Anaeromyxobacter TaxID=2620896 RepID=UPI001F57DF31|nr:MULTISPECIES: insulinase family protein [unclassified Anaeromyxobacter]